jgi:hypothetical protein
MRATDRLHSSLRKAKVLYLARLNQILHRSGHVFDRHVRVNTVLIEQINDISPESFERGIGDLLDVLGAAIQSCLFACVRVEFETELGSDHHSVAERSKGLADQLFIRERRLVKIFMRRDHSIGVGRRDALDSKCHVADLAQAEQGQGRAERFPCPGDSVPYDNALGTG